jgi:hypothetical protein
VAKKETGPGFYGPGMRSPQSVEWMKATDVPANYLRASIARRDEIRAMQAARDTPERKLHHMASFGGQRTFTLKKP